MNIIFLMLPIALVLGFGFLGLFIRFARNGEFDDLETPAHRIFLEDENSPASSRDIRKDRKNDVS